MRYYPVTSYEQKYIDLVSRIDRGEYGLEVEGEAAEGVEKWISKVVFEGDENYGMLSIFCNYGALRIHLVFEEDMDREDNLERIAGLLNDVIWKSAFERAYIWCTNDNPKLIEGLRKRLPLEDGVYSTNELAYPRQKIPEYVDISPLWVMPYSDGLLDEVLALLEDSFVDLASPGYFANNRDEYHRKFSQTGQSRFEAFSLGDATVGMYYHHDAELEYIAVSPRYQNRGYGALILKRALSMIAWDSERQPHLYCVNQNTRGLRFYEREGWFITGKAVMLTYIKKSSL